MKDSFDIWSFVLSLPWPILAVFATYGVYVLVRDMGKFNSQLNQLILTVDHLGKATLNKDNEPIFDYKTLIEIREQLINLKIEFDDHSDLFEAHHADVARMKAGEPWKNCLIDHCPNLGGIIHKVDMLIKLFDTFDDKAEQSRQSTGVTLTQISSQLSDIIKQLSSDAAESRKNTQDALANIMARLDTFLTQVLDLAIKQNKGK